jgi:hypothetical protein
MTLKLKVKFEETPFPHGFNHGRNWMSFINDQLTHVLIFIEEQRAEFENSRGTNVMRMIIQPLRQ